MRLALRHLPMVLLAAAGSLAAQDGPYKVLTKAKVGGEGGTDYITADPVGRRLYIPRGRTPDQPATDTSPARPGSPARYR